MLRISTPPARLLVVAGATTLVALAGAAAPAQAATTTLDYQCKYPILGTEPLSLAISLDIPDTWPRGVDTPPFGMSVVATGGGDTAAGLELIDDLTSIEGKARAHMTVFLPQGGSQAIRVPLTLENTVLPTPKPDPLVLNFSGSTPSLTFDEPGASRITLDRFSMNLTVRDSFGDPIVLPHVSRDVNGNLVPEEDDDPNTFDVSCKLEPGQAPEGESPEIGNGFEVPPDCYECEPPTIPLEVDGFFEDFTSTSIRVRWGASTDNVGVTEYIVRYDGKEVRVPATSSEQLSTLIEGLVPDTEYFFEISAMDAAGAESEPLQLLLVTRPPEAPPAKVTGLAGTPMPTAVALNWTAVTDPANPVASYNVYNGPIKVATVTGTSATVTGLDEDTTYAFAVEAVSGSGLVGQRSDPITVRTHHNDVFPRSYSFKLGGSTAVKTLTKGNLPLVGALERVEVLVTGQLSGDLTLADTQGRLTALGFLPVTAKVGFVPSGRTTGTLRSKVLTTQSLFRIKVKEVKLFGAIPLAGGNNCQTRQLSEINLQSTEAQFSPLLGGPIAGTYRISDLNGCGVLNGLVSPLTAGAGNTINAVLTPKG